MTAARIGWQLFAISIIVAAGLVLWDLQSPPPDPRRAAGAPRAPAARPEAAQGSAAGAEIARGADPDPPEPADPAGPAGEDESPPDAALPQTPDAFFRHLIGLALEGDIETLIGLVRPGAARAARPLFEGILFRGDGEIGKTERTFLQNLRAEFEETPEGYLRLNLIIPLLPESERPKDTFYLIPHEGSWKLATESDLPGPAMERTRAVRRLQLLAVCQQTYFAEDLDGDGPDYAATDRELLEGLERSPAFAGGLDSDLAAAADAGLLLDGYQYGRIKRGTNDFAYYAAPGMYGAESRDTYVIDGKGQVWSKDLGGAAPPAEWPDPHRAENGWTRGGGSTWWGR
ncbi:MAG: hypothetical protein JXP34_16015 [Planctomycetes bacterium]|nr:hypothetical protein [Planctomycetota bacterium]